MNPIKTPRLYQTLVPYLSLSLMACLTNCLFKPLILFCNVGLIIGLKTEEIHENFFSDVRDYYLCIIYQVSLRSLNHRQTLSRFPLEAGGGKLHYSSIPLLTKDSGIRKGSIDRLTTS